MKNKRLTRISQWALVQILLFSVLVSVGGIFSVSALTNTQEADWSIGADWSVIPDRQELAFTTNRAGTSTRLQYQQPLTAAQGFFIQFDLEWDKTQYDKQLATWWITSREHSASGQLLFRNMSQYGRICVEGAYMGAQNTWSSLQFSSQQWYISDHFARVRIWVTAGTNRLNIVVSDDAGRERYTSFVQLDEAAPYLASDSLAFSFGADGVMSKFSVSNITVNTTYTSDGTPAANTLERADAVSQMATVANPFDREPDRFAVVSPEPESNFPWTILWAGLGIVGGFSVTLVVGIILTKGKKGGEKPTDGQADA